MTAGPDRLPAIVITRGDPVAGDDPERDAGFTAQYAAAITRAGGEAVVLFASADSPTRSAALERMAGLLLAGGEDLQSVAWQAAESRGLPVLGICRGFHAINVLCGGGLTQHLEGHARPYPGEGPPVLHRLRVGSGTQLARILRPTNPLTFVVQVNSSHSQAVGGEDLAPSLLASGWSPGVAGEIVEALEARDPSRFILGVQCHPERTDSTPPEFERLFRFFVDAARHATRGQARPA